MDRRLTLQAKLEEILGSDHVYFNPPENYRLRYPCIVYDTDDVERLSADNFAYIKHVQYTVTYISTKPDMGMVYKLMDLPLCSFERHYKADDLEHYVLNLYW